MADLVGADVYDAANGGVATSLSAVKSGARWRDELNQPGAGQLTVNRGDTTALAALAYGAVVRMKAGGVDRFAWRVEQKTYRTIIANGKANAVVEISGRGLGSLLEEVELYPENGVGRLTPDYRLFNFASPSYDETGRGWVAATEIKQQNASTPAQWVNAPADWPDPSAWWIWAQAQSGDPPQPVGDCYFRTTFTTATQQSLRAYISADDGFELFFDGNRVTGETLAFMWGVTKYADLGLVDAGTHTIAIKGTNIQRVSTSTNIAGVICSVVEMVDGGQTVGDVRCRTDNTWHALAYPADPPGMTPDEIAAILLDEAQDPSRGALTGMTCSASGRLDSDGNAFDTVDIGFPVGTSYLSVFTALAELGVDFAFGPSGLVLDLYQGRGSDLSASVALNESNLAELLHDGRAPTLNVGLARYGSGAWYEQVDITSVGAWRRKEGMLQAGTAPSQGASDHLITAQFDTRAQPVRHVVGTIVDDAPAGVTPYVDFDLGDTVSVVDEDLAPADERTWAFNVTVDQAGYAVYEVEF